MIRGGGGVAGAFGRSPTGSWQRIWVRLPTRDAPCRGCSFHPTLYPSTCWMVQRLTSRSLASSRWLTPFDRSTKMYSRC